MYGNRVQATYTKVNIYIVLAFALLVYGGHMNVQYAVMFKVYKCVLFYLQSVQLPTL